MKIAVCIKRVPDSETRVKIAADGKSLDEAGVKFILNPYDEFAVEEALRQKEKAGTGEVVVIALGPPAAQETIPPRSRWVPIAASCCRPRASTPTASKRRGRSPRSSRTTACD